MIAFASFEGFAGCLTSARHAAAVLGGTAHALGPGAAPPECDLLVLSSWHESYEGLLDAAAPVVARWHSPLLQTELSDDGWKIERLLELRASGRLRAVAFNDEDAARALGGVHLPDVLAAAPRVTPLRLDGVNVTLLGEPYPRKNVVVQAAAFAHAAQPDWTLHVAGRRADRYAAWFDRLGGRWVDHGSLAQDELLALVAGCDAGLSATLSESYGYLAAEHLQLGIPVVTSLAVRCADTGDLQIEDAGSVEVAAALRCAIGADVTAAQRSLRERAAANADIARAVLAELAA